MSDQSNQTMPIDPYAYIGMVRNSDGSITRLQEISPALDLSNFHSLSQVLTKDVSINNSKSTWARIMLPPGVLHNSMTKLPLVVYFHGGGFVMASVDSSFFQGLCASVACEIPAIVVSVEYRRAPEHRLPAAYEDCMEGLHWIKNKPDEWIAEYADLSNCFLMGTSAGGNIAYHLGLEAAASCDNLKPLQIKGLILHHSFFGGKERTKSELRLAHDKVLPPNVSDIMWELALPEGADHDHEYSNPIVGIKSNPNLFDRFKLLCWKILVSGCDGDPLIDRQIDLVKALKELGVQVVDRFTPGGFHGLELVDSLRCNEFIISLKEFMTTS